MAHKVLIGGTAYAVAKGRTLVNGTGRDIKKGRTVINGAGYDIAFGAPLKWLLNATPAVPSWDEVRAKFTSTDLFGTTNEYIGIRYGYHESAGRSIQYIYLDNNGEEDATPVYITGDKTWTASSYRTITFAEPPEDELLEWLEANGTPQE
nr:MAG TPA: hypothetical protein [Caudoviricetes sp.]